MDTQVTMKLNISQLAKKIEEKNLVPSGFSNFLLNFHLTKIRVPCWKLETCKTMCLMHFREKFALIYFRLLENSLHEFSLFCREFSYFSTIEINVATYHNEINLGKKFILARQYCCLPQRLKSMFLKKKFSLLHWTLWGHSNRKNFKKRWF